MCLEAGYGEQRGKEEEEGTGTFWPIILLSRGQWDFSKKSDFHLSMKSVWECVDFAMHGIDCMWCWATGLFGDIYAHMHCTCTLCKEKIKS